MRVPVGARSSPAKGSAETWAPGVGQRRSRSCPDERERARRAHAACTGEEKALGSRSLLGPGAGLEWAWMGLIPMSP